MKLITRKLVLTLLVAQLIIVQPLAVFASSSGQQTVESQRISLDGTWHFTTGDPVEGPWQPIEIANGHLSETLLPSQTTAWYQKTFTVPEDFSREPTVLWAGKIDDADMVMINGVVIGQTGLDEKGSYEGISYWEKTREYVVPDSVLKYGGTNTITIRVYNDGGAGGIYEGGIGIYTIPALRQAKGLPSELASETEQNLVLAKVTTQKDTIEQLDVEAYRQTLASDYFHDGYTITRAVSELKQWSGVYDEMEINDERVYVFKDGDTFIYTAYRTMIGIDSSGKRAVVWQGDVERYYQDISDEIVETGNQSRFYVDHYYSALFNKEMTFRIYLPEGYQTSGRNYPTVYLLHQYNSSSQQFEVDQLHKQLDAWMAANMIQDMIVVMPDTSGTSWYVNMPNEPWQDLITDELIPIVDERYRTIDDPDYRAISGISMGGFGAYVIGLQHPELFRSIASHMGALGFEFAGQKPLELIKQYNEKETDPSADVVYLKQFSLYLDGGTEDRLTSMEDSTDDIHEYLRNNDIVHYYYTGPGEHNSEFYMSRIQESFIMHHNHFSQGLITGSITASPQAITLTDDKTVMSYTVNLNQTRIAKFVSSDLVVLPLEVTLTVKNAITGETAGVKSEVVTDLLKSSESNFTGDFTINKADLNDGNLYTAQVEAELLGISFPLGALSLVKVEPTGNTPEDTQIDLMGNWKFIKEDLSEPIQGEDPNLDDSGWRTVQPGLGWWSDGFGGYMDLGSYLGGAWYRRSFHVPSEFPAEQLTLLVGKIDDADEVYINGHLVGATGMQDGEFIESFWAQLREYSLDPAVLNYGGENTIAIRMYNSNGGGGLYSGPIGIYTKEALRKAKGLPYEIPSVSTQNAVLAVVQAQNEALEEKDFDEFLATISDDYFQNGKNKQAFSSEWKTILDSYDGIRVELSRPEIYRSEDNILLLADRTVTGTAVDGTQTVLYSGGMQQYFRLEDGKWLEIGDQSHTYAESYYSSAIGQEMTYRIFLPPSYANSTKRYPVVYLLHQFQSDSSAFILDNVHGLLDQSMRSGELEEMIVVMPDSDGMSWWINQSNGPAWEDMVVKDLVPWIDAHYRTMKDADFRGISGVSMGGFGSFAIGFGNPEVFHSVASHMGALGFTMEEINPTQMLKSLDMETLAQYSIYLDSGDKDGYKFDLSALEVHRYLRELNIPHSFEIRDGVHDSAFYTASILKSFQHHADHFIRSSHVSSIPLDSGGASNPVEIGIEGTDVINLEAKIEDESKGIASVFVDGTVIQEMLHESEPLIDGKRRLRLNIAEVTDAGGYAVQLPMESLATIEGNLLEISTPAGIAVVPDDLFDSFDVRSDSTVTITLMPAASIELEEDAKAKVGDRPILGISITHDENSVHLNKLNKPITIAIKYNPDQAELQDSHQLIIVQVTASGQVKPVINSRYDDSGYMLFAVNEVGHYGVAYVKNTFDDLIGHWSKRQVEWLASRGIMNGLSPTKFGPSEKVTRADFVLLLVQAFGLSSTHGEGFTDVPNNAYYYDAVQTAKSLGIVSGLEDNRFRPMEYLTRQEMMVMVYKLMTATGKTLTSNSDSVQISFQDVNQVSEDALESVIALVRAGFIIGNGNRLEPDRMATRAEVAAVIERLLNELV